MKKAIIVIVLVLFSNNLLYVKNAKIDDTSVYRTQREYFRAIHSKNMLQKETVKINLVLVGLLLTSLSVASLKKSFNF